MMKRILLSLCGLALLVAFAGTFYFLYAKSQEEPVVWQTAEPFSATILQKTVATGSVVPRKEVTIKPKVSGIIEELYIEPGVEVAKGDRMARIAIVPDMVTLSNAETRVNRARIGLENAQKEFDRNRELFEEGLLSEATFLTFDLAQKNAQEELSAAEDNLALVREGARKRTGIATNTVVRATVPGMVLEVPIEVGDSVIESNTFNDGTTIATIADMDELVFEGLVDESEVGKLREGMELLLTIGALDTEQFAATLEYIAPKGVEENGAIQFEIRAALILKDDFFVRANYSANADIVLARRDEVMAVKESWLQFDDGEPYIEVQTADQEFERRPIETGLSDGINIEVLSGVQETDQIKDPGSAQAAGA
ncbi:MAG: efflux RND transporter periplasmic adaptor subunit [Acidobacteriota bacterium]